MRMTVASIQNSSLLFISLFFFHRNIFSSTFFICSIYLLLLPPPPTFCFPLLSSPLHATCLTSLISFLLSFPLQYHLESLLLPPSLPLSLPIYNSIPLVQSFPYFNWILATLERLERDFRVCMELVGMSSSRDIKQIAF